MRKWLRFEVILVVGIIAGMLPLGIAAVMVERQISGRDVCNHSTSAYVMMKCLD